MDCMSLLAEAVSYCVYRICCSVVCGMPLQVWVQLLPTMCGGHFAHFDNREKVSLIDYAVHYTKHHAVGPVVFVIGNGILRVQSFARGSYM